MKVIIMSNEQKVTRKLRAIFSADVKGYSVLMADDEVSTIQTLKDYRNIMSTCIEQRGGRIVDAVGDNLLAEFDSAVDAVQCAVEVQKGLRDKNQELPENKKMEFRIGINIADPSQVMTFLAQTPSCLLNIGPFFFDFHRGEQEF